MVITEIWKNAFFINYGNLWFSFPLHWDKAQSVTTSYTVQIYRKFNSRWEGLQKWEGQADKSDLNRLALISIKHWSNVSCHVSPRTRSCSNLQPRKPKWQGLTQVFMWVFWIWLNFGSLILGDQHWSAPSIDPTCPVIHLLGPVQPSNQWNPNGRGLLT